jgi:hypothetical protein
MSPMIPLLLVTVAFLLPEMKILSLSSIDGIML